MSHPVPREDFNLPTLDPYSLSTCLYSCRSDWSDRSSCAQKNNSINLIEQHQFYFRISHVLERCNYLYDLANIENDTSNQQQTGPKEQIQLQQV